MVQYRNMRTSAVRRADASIDQGLRSYMLGIYNLMAIGLVVTALVSMATAYLAATNPAFQMLIYRSPLRFVIMFAPLAAVLFMSFRIQNLSTGAARAVFFVFASLVGVSISTIFFLFEKQSIAQTFFIAAATFGALSLYGYSTKRDLRPLGTFLFIGLVGILIASIVNIFLLQSSALQFAVSVIGVLVFAGLTAYDTQTIKEMYYEGDSADAMGRKIVMGALNLYLDLINMFLFLLQLFGNRN